MLKSSFAIVLFAVLGLAEARAVEYKDGPRLADPAVLEALRATDTPGLPKNLTPGERPYLSLPDLSLELRQPPDVDQLRTFSEYERNQAILMRWRPNVHNAVLTQMIVPITTGDRHAKVMLVVRPSSSDQSHAINALTAAGADMSRVEFVHAANDSIWIRDYGPRFASADGERILVDHNYNRQRPNDNQVPSAVASYLGEALYELPLSHGGGNFHLFSNGEAFMADLILNENPGYSEQQVIDLYAQYHGLDLTILGSLPSSFDSTQHLDMWFLPVDDQTVIIGDYTQPPPGVSPAPASVINVTESTASLMQSRGYSVIRTPGWRSGSHYSYTNSVIINDVVAICRFNGYESQNATALAIYEQAFPDKVIVAVDCSTIITQSGSLHCIVKHKPFRASFTLQLDPPSGSLCLPQKGNDSLVVDVTMDGINGYDLPVMLTASGLPAGVSSEFESDFLEGPGATSWTLTVESGAAAGTIELTLSADDGDEIKQLPFTLLLENPPVATTLLLPETGALDVSLQPELVWTAVDDVTTYTIQVATDAGFADVVIEEVVAGTEFTPVGALEIGTDYFWRVRGQDHCGDGYWSGVFEFQSRFDPIAGVNPAQLDFAVNTANSDNQTLTIGNDGSGALNWSMSTTACGSEVDTDWLGVNPASGSVLAGEFDELEVTVNTEGLALGIHEAELCLTTNQAEVDPLSIPVVLDVLDLVPGELVLDPGILSFGEVGVGSGSIQTVTVSNAAEEGSADLEISQVVILSGQAVFEIIGSDCGEVLPAQTQCVVEVQFSPASSTAYSGVLRVTAGGPMKNASLQGSGADQEVEIFQDRFEPQGQVEDQ